MTDQLPKGLGWLTHWRGWLTRRGVNFDQFCLLLSTKLLLVTRSSSGLGLRLNQSAKPSAHPLRTSFLWNLLIGGALAIFLALPLPLMFGLSSFTSALFLMFFLTMLTSYATLLLDPKDRLIFGVRGVGDRTLNAVRVGLVTLFLGATMLAQGGPAIIVLVLRFGPLVGLAGLVSVVLLGVFALMIALLFYLLVLRFFDGEKLKNILNIVQIALVAGIYLVSQLPNLLPNSVDFSGLLHTGFSWWYLIALPVWFAGLPLLAHGTFTALAFLLTALSLIGTGALTWAYLHNAAAFEQYLEKLDQSGTTIRHNSRYFRLMRRLFAGHGDEAAYFTLGWRMLQSEREYKLRVYPQLVYGLILPLVIGANVLREMSFSQASHFLVYLGVGVIFGLPTAIWFLAYSSQPEAMGVFRYVPLAHPGLLLRGIVKAVFARIFLPLLLVIAVVALTIGGVHAITPVALSIALTYMVALVYGRIMGPKQLPFSEEFGPQKGMQGGAIGFAMVFVGMIFLALIIFVGGIVFSPWLDLAAIALAALVAWLIGRGYKTMVI